MIALYVALGFGAVAVGFIAVIKVGKFLARFPQVDAAPIEPEPVIDFDLLEVELSMEFHDWKRAA
ncbi:hypothetical protein ASG25_10785 [Rhizobium sp. Leaf384]|uniref:hypothetical protein n=1 Tax=Rhizobium sp. Leaf384 TaxID=1736358 RepID=UPI000715DBA2|nr:hypothetical protein [Rhizobium sp. Leaf384]KQS79063.1 hypothetical protein ASG25_10785 [Rhizobium sp. Leaf384]